MEVPHCQTAFFFGTNCSTSYTEVQLCWILYYTDQLFRLEGCRMRKSNFVSKDGACLCFSGSATVTLRG